MLFMHSVIEGYILYLCSLFLIPFLFRFCGYLTEYSIGESSSKPSRCWTEVMSLVLLAPSFETGPGSVR